MQNFLKFLVEETLAGRGGAIKEYVIAVSVFGKPEVFNPNSSAVVRVEAGRLRRLLAQFDAEFGASAELRLTIPKGSYVPIFEHAAKTDAQEAGLDAPAPASAEPKTGPEPTWRAPAERRLVTVLACSLATPDGTWNAFLDSDFLGSFDMMYGLFSSIAARHGGTIDSGASDRLVAYFGWPDPMEDAAGRALTSALDIISAAGQAFAPGRCGVHIGVATSEVALWSQTERGAALPKIVGRAPALAEDLMARAPLNGILVAEETRRLTGTSFDFVPAGLRAGGSADQTPSWRLLSARPQITRFQALALAHVDVLIGRREELALLTSRWTLATEGEGQAVLMTGEAGMGKSRLAEAFIDHVAPAAGIIRIQCSPHHRNAALQPWVDFIRTELDGPREEAPSREQISRYLAQHRLDSEMNRDLLTALLGFSSAPTVQGLTPSRQKDLTLKLLAQTIFSQLDEKPLFLLVEDIHWADPTTEELLHDILSSMPETRLLLIMTSRPDVITSAFRQTVITSIRLARLSKAQSASLVDEIAGPIPLSMAVRSMILEKAEGVPLFIEELTKLALAGGGNQLEEQPFSGRLEDLFSGHFSQLGKARGVAQIAAVIGRQFSCRMLAAVAGESADAIDVSVDQLTAAGIIMRQAGARSEELSFRHALLRDAAYNGLLPSTRRQLHEKTAQVLVEYFPEIAVQQPQLIALHLTKAERYEEAVPFWLDAGDRAAGSFALTEAAAIFHRTLDALRHLPGSAQRREWELKTLISLGSAVRTAKGYSDEELLSIYGAARQIATESNQVEALANAIYGLWTHAAGAGQWTRAIRLAEEFEALTKPIADNGQYAIEAARLKGASAAIGGQFTAARACFERALDIYDPQVHGPVLGFDPGFTCSAYLSWTLLHLGEKTLARQAVDRTLAMAEAKQHPPTLAMVLSWLIFYAMCERDSGAVIALNERLQSVCVERDCRYWQPLGAAADQWARFQQNPQERRLSAFLKHVDEFGENYLRSTLLLLAAQMSDVIGNIEQGLDLVAQARSFMEEHGERLWEAESYRLEAELRLRTADADQARIVDLLRKAVETAGRQSARPFEKAALGMLRKVENMPKDLTSAASGGA